MNTIASKPSTVAGTDPKRGKNFNLRAFFAGGAATVALIAAGIILFGSLAAYVAFNGLPVGGGDDAGDTVAVQAAGGGASGAPAAALAAAPAAVAATAAAPTAIAPAATPGDAPAPGDPADPGDPVPVPPEGPPPADAPPVTTPTGVPGGGTTSGPAGNAVQQVDDTASGAGVDLPLSETTGSVTGPVDEAVGGALDQVGGAVDSPDLGQNAGGAVNGVTDGVLDD